MVMVLCVMVGQDDTRVLMVVLYVMVDQDDTRVLMVVLYVMVGQDDTRVLVDPTQPGSSRLIIQSVNRSDAGLYTCLAVNDAGNNTFNVSLVVHCTSFSRRPTHTAQLSLLPPQDAK